MQNSFQAELSKPRDSPLEFLNSQIKIKEEEMKLRKKYHDIPKLKNYLPELSQSGP